MRCIANGGGLVPLKVYYTIGARALQGVRNPRRKPEVSRRHVACKCECATSNLSLGVGPSSCGSCGFFGFVLEHIHTHAHTAPSSPRLHIHTQSHTKAALYRYIARAPCLLCLSSSWILFFRCRIAVCVVANGFRFVVCDFFSFPCN